jgi:hypothetical protein
MTKREKLYHSLVKKGKLLEHKLAKKKLRYAKKRKKPTGIYIDMRVLREKSLHSNISVKELLDLTMTQNIYLGKTGS